MWCWAGNAKFVGRAAAKGVKTSKGRRKIRINAADVIYGKPAKNVIIEICTLQVEKRVSVLNHSGCCTAVRAAVVVVVG